MNFPSCANMRAWQGAFCADEIPIKPLDRCMKTEYNRISALYIGMIMTKGGNKIYVLQKLCRGFA